MLKEVLKAIADGKSTIKEIAKATQMEKSAVVHAISELKKMGYLEGSICSMDKPMCKNCPFSKELPNLGMTLCITKKGLEYLKK